MGASIVGAGEGGRASLRLLSVLVLRAGGVRGELLREREGLENTRRNVKHRRHPVSNREQALSSQGIRARWTRAMGPGWRRRRRRRGTSTAGRDGGRTGGMLSAAIGAWPAVVVSWPPRGRRADTLSMKIASTSNNDASQTTLVQEDKINI
jgi:hypothetical protein